MLHATPESTTYVLYYSSIVPSIRHRLHQGIYSRLTRSVPGEDPYRRVMPSLGEQEASPDPRPPAPGEVPSSMHDKTIPGKNRTGW